jgi:hypothetical protein
MCKGGKGKLVLQIEKGPVPTYRANTKLKTKPQTTDNERIVVR